MFGFKLRKQQAERIASLEKRIIDAEKILNDASNDYKNGQFSDPHFVASMIAEARRELGGCVYPDGPQGCNCVDKCKATWPPKKEPQI